ncbi:MAG TPA: hypothetical protein VMI94_02315 [Bryobacteraceae bacterium]|nr:hypothetical protein [Bryobacteraceae bacterium]
MRRIAMTAFSCAFLLAVPVFAAGTTGASTKTAWPAETLSGKIMMVKPAQDLAVVKGPDGVPFDMIVTHRTRIEAGNQKLTLADLQADTSRNVSVRFVPQRRGDVARSIQVTP